jgi:hypothetical protein
MTLRIDPDCDPKDVYEVKPVPPELRGPPTDWWMVTANGKPVHFFAPGRRDLAERYATDPEFRKSLVKTNCGKNRSATNQSPSGGSSTIRSQRLRAAISLARSSALS